MQQFKGNSLPPASSKKKWKLVRLLASLLTLAWLVVMIPILAYLAAFDSIIVRQTGSMTHPILEIYNGFIILEGEEAIMDYLSGGIFIGMPVIVLLIVAFIWAEKRIQGFKYKGGRWRRE